MKYTIYKSYDAAQAALEALPPVTGYAGEHLKSSWQKEQDAIDSFERCDTDGYLSQWCSSLTASKYRLEHQLALQGGHGVFRCLVDAETGALASTKLFRFKNNFGYGNVFKWAVPTDDGTAWLTDYRRESSWKKAGLRVAWILAPAYVDNRCPLDRTPTQYGTGGLCNVRYSKLLDRRAAGLEI